MAKGHKTGGRAKGTPNKSTAELKALAQQYSKECIEELKRLALNADSDAARVSAIREILDRGHGKPAQAMAITGEDGGPVEQIIQVVTGVPRSA